MQDGLKLDGHVARAPPKRQGRSAVELVENGEAEVVVVAYFDRLVPLVGRPDEVVERIEKAGGRILAVDVGEVRADTASRWLSSTMLGSSRSITVAPPRRTAEAKRRAVNAESRHSRTCRWVTSSADRTSNLTGSRRPRSGRHSA